MLRSIDIEWNPTASLDRAYVAAKALMGTEQTISMKQWMLDADAITPEIAANWAEYYGGVIQPRLRYLLNSVAAAAKAEGVSSAAVLYPIIEASTGRRSRVWEREAASQRV